MLGALLIQIRRAPGGDPRIMEITDGNEVTITGHVVREGYGRADGPRSIRRPIDIETESIESVGKIVDIRDGVRLTILEVVHDEGTASGYRLTSAAKADTDSDIAARVKSCPPETVCRSRSYFNCTAVMPRNAGVAITMTPPCLNDEETSSLETWHPRKNRQARSLLPSQSAI